MTNAKPTSNPSQIRSSDITPPPELLKQWEDDWFEEHEHADVLLIQAFQAGADQELEACCECIAQWYRAQSFLKLDGYDPVPLLRIARRPKPPSLAEEALEALLHLLDGAAHSMDTTEPAEYIRRALERLQQLENNQ